MKNDLIYTLSSKVIIRVKGMNMDRFIHRLVNHKIQLLNIKYIDRKTVDITIYNNDYEKAIKIKSIYEVDPLDYKGVIKIKKKIKKSKIIIISVIIGFIFLIFLTNIIFSVEVVHTNKELRALLYKELDMHGIKKYNFKKTFEELENIKREIISKNKDKIEWLEIERVGTKYVIRVEMRKISSIPVEGVNRHVVALKDAIIKKVIAKEGEIIKNTNEYVKKGDVVISGNIKLNDETKKLVSAEGEVYAEVWYQTTVEYPLNYYEQKETGNKKNILVLKLLNNEFGFLDFKPYKEKKGSTKKLLSHHLLPFSLEYQKQKEIIIIDEKLDSKNAIIKAELLAREKMQSKLNDNEYIINQKNLKIEIKDSKITLDSFFTVYENITGYMEIVEEITKEE